MKFTPEMWLQFSSILLDPDMSAEKGVHKYMTAKDQSRAKVILNRLAHTEPQVLVEKLTKSTAAVTKCGCLWRGAVMNLGSWYRKKKEPKQKQQTLQSAFKKNGNKGPTSKAQRGMAQKSLNSALQKATEPEHKPLDESNEDAPKENSMDIDNSEVEVMQVEPATTLQSPTNSYAAAVQGSIATQNGTQVEVTPELSLIHI